MQPLAIISLAFAPGLFWLWQIYSQDRYRPQPKGLVARTFILGAAAAIPISVVEGFLSPGPSLETILARPENLISLAYIAFIVAGLTEELGKYLVVRQTIYSSPYFDEPMSGLIYASAAALGFASLENLGYLFIFGPEVILIRGPISTLAHVFFSATWGFPLGWQKSRTRLGRWLTLLGLVASMALHGLFDFLLFTQSQYSLLAIPLFIIAGVAFLLLLRLAANLSPYRDKVAAVLIACPRCGQESGAGAAHCTACGSYLAPGGLTATGRCSRCAAPQSPQARFCTACDSRLDRKLVKAP